MVDMANKFQFKITSDGSPTMEMLNSEGRREKMHHYMGALSETLHVYGRALEMAFQANKSPNLVSVFSLGLGLAYNEILSAAIAEKFQSPVCIWSFEREDGLREMFRQWLTENISIELQPLSFAQVTHTLQPATEEEQKAYFEFEKLDKRDFFITYNWILHQIAQNFEIQASQIYRRLQIMYRDDLLKILSEFNTDFNLKGKRFHVYLYDAFSDKINPELWDTISLEKTLDISSHETCVFATYAAKGRLNKILKSRNFILLDVPGFGNKRECTIAIREQ